MDKLIEIIDEIHEKEDSTDENLRKLIEFSFCNAENDENRVTEREEISQYLFAKAREKAKASFGNKIYTRGLIEITNYCKNNCYYCGIRKGNREVQRYRLTKDDILTCCKNGYKIGFRTFVLQGGEDSFFTEELVADIVSSIKEKFRDCAVTLSLGEKTKKEYQSFFDAGADRYLLRHETADWEHYAKLHPADMKWEHRKKCLYDLKSIGFQTGCGIMVGSPYQTAETLLKDLRFMQELQPEMIGIGPFISHHQTPFAKEKNGDLFQALVFLAIVRLLMPEVLLPSTTALGTINMRGREKGILAGANVVMPNLSPLEARKAYTLYDNKKITDEEAAEGRSSLKKQIEAIGYELAVERGDYRKVGTGENYV